MNEYNLANEIAEAEFSDDEFHDFNERAGIREFEGKTPRAKAERLAFNDVMRERND